MVYLTLQPIFSDLVRHDGIVAPEELFSMWSLTTKAKNAIVQGYRLENLSWRLWSRIQRQRSSPPDNSRGGNAEGSKRLSICTHILSEVQDAAPKETVALPELRRHNHAASFRGSPSSAMTATSTARRKKKNIESYLQRHPPSLTSLESTVTDTSFMSSDDILVPLEPKPTSAPNPAGEEERLMFQKCSLPLPTASSLLTPLFRCRLAGPVPAASSHPDIPTIMIVPERPSAPAPPDLDAYPKNLPVQISHSRQHHFRHRSGEGSASPILDLSAMSIW